MLSRRVVVLIAAVSFLSTCIRAQTGTTVADAQTHRPQAGPETVVVTGNVHAGATDVDLQQCAPNIIQGDLSIRGSSFGQALVLVDGLRMDDVQRAHLDMYLPPPSGSVDRVEVSRGAGSTLCGSDAVAGSINVITALPEHSDFRAGAGVGNFGVNQQSGSTALAGGKFDTEFGSKRDFSSGFRPDRDYWSFTRFSSTSARRRFRPSSPVPIILSRPAPTALPAMASIQ